MAFTLVTYEHKGMCMVNRVYHITLEGFGVSDPQLLISDVFGMGENKPLSLTLITSCQFMQMNPKSRFEV